MTATIKENTAALNALLDKANALPDGSGGGGTVRIDTCTINVPEISAWGAVFYVTRYLDGRITASAVTTSVIENVVCGSVVTLSITPPEYPYGYTVSGAEILYERGGAPVVLAAPTEAGAVATITFAS